MGEPWIEDMAWDEVRDRLAAGAVVVIPLGAAAKEHGRHLPLGTDALVARELAARVAARLPVLVAPVLGLGHYPAFTAYAGSQSLAAETFIRVVAEVAGGLAAQGARRLAVINTGVSTEVPLRAAAARVAGDHGVPLHILDLRRMGRDADALLDHPGGGHADERETSVMLAVDPSRVRLGRLTGQEGDDDRPGPLDPAHNPTGVIGFPAAAAAAKGRAILAAVTDDLVAGLTAAFPDLAVKNS
ncbi:MAG: creatininase family protein [Hyphomicrobiales bacterium]|nr:creatininase family protein [Hyphomicrobiales bacterium]